jgi:thiol:disulfide interchange protein DsbD
MVEHGDPQVFPELGRFRGERTIVVAGRGVAGGVVVAQDARGGVAHNRRFENVPQGDLDAAVARASAAGQPVMLDFYADWCVSCKEMEKYTFPDPAVRAALGNALLLRADVTANDATDQALLQRFGIFGPPTIAFYGADGVERANLRVVGFMKATEFAAVAQRAVQSAP